MKAHLFLAFGLLMASADGWAGILDNDGDGVADDVDNCINEANPGQIDTDDDGFGNLCDPDVTNDLTTNFADLLVFRDAFFTTPTVPEWVPVADLNSDNVINFGDLEIVRRFFFLPPGPSGDACQPPAPGMIREDSNYANPTPRVALRTAIADYQRTNPDAVFGFFNCEVDYFSAPPKGTIPGYARDVLVGLGLPVKPVVPVLMLGPVADPKLGQDLDAPENQVFQFPLLLEPEDPTPPPDGELVDLVEFDPSPTNPPEVVRTRPPRFLDTPPDPYVPPDPDAQSRNAPAAMPIMAAFIGELGEIFRMPRDPSGGADLSSLTGMKYSEGRFGRRVGFDGQMLAGVPVMDGKTVIDFDDNWNVIQISRQLMTPQKLSIPAVTPIPETQGRALALAAAAEFHQLPQSELVIDDYQIQVDPIRRIHAARVHIVVDGSPEVDTTVLLKAETGELLNISDNISAYTDAKLKRWAYSGGNLVSGAYQVNSTGIYTRDDNTLRHDFFYMETDQRGGGDFPSPLLCSQTPKTTTWFGFAYNTTDGAQFIRHTHRPNRDFNIWSPASSSGSFQESNAYFWARKFALWLKPSLSHLGVLPASSSSYPRFTMIINACTDDWYSTPNLPITTQHNEGETRPKIRLREDCKSTNANCAASDYDDSGGDFVTCEGNGCGTTPAVIQHEMNHFFLNQYFDVGSSLDCGSGNQLKFVHEGTLGSVVPQAFWHFYYGVGYNPPDSHLFTKDQPRGRVHANNATNLKLSSWLCVNNKTGQGPYDAGRVASQPMWEFYHGKRADGNSLVNILRPANDLTFLNLTYRTADLVAASTWKDRFEVANRWMQLANGLTFTDNAQKQLLRTQWCATWDHHQLKTYINNAYCP